MSCIHYKLKSFLDYKTLTFDGLHISVGDLKREIQEKEKIGSRGAFDLLLTNAQTKRVYKEDTELIPRNSSVTVARIPAAEPKRLPKMQGGNNITEGSVLQPKMSAGQKAPSVSNIMFKDPNALANSNMTEQEKLDQIRRDATKQYDPTKFQRKNSLMTGPPPPTYVCNRCGKAGHWYKNCPMLGVKLTTGIMSSELVQTTSDDPHARMDPWGNWVVPRLHREAYDKGKTEKAPFMEVEGGTEFEQTLRPKIPGELLCDLCEDLLRDAVMILCCGDSFCDDCIRPKLMDANTNRECPHCHETGISPDSLVPNAKLRKAVQNFQNETGYSHYQKKQPLMRISIPSGQGPATSGPVPLAAPLQALLNRFMQPSQTSTQQGATPPAGASPVQQTREDSPIFHEIQDSEKPAVTATVVTGEDKGPQIQDGGVHGGVPVHVVPPVQIVPPQRVGLPVPITQHPPIVSHIPPANIAQKPPLAAVAPMQMQPYNVSQPPPVIPNVPTVKQPATTLAPPGVPFHQHVASMAPPGVSPPPANSALASQPPPPGLVANQPQPPGVGFGITERKARSPKHMGTDAWDEYLARKDQKKKRDSSSSTESSSSSSSSYSRSRSRSRSRSHSPHSRRRSPHRDRSDRRSRRRRRSYSRSRSRSPTRHHRHRSPRTPSPNWSTAAFAHNTRPVYSNQQRIQHRRARSPNHWFIYAGGSQRAPPQSSFLHNLAAVTGQPRGPFPQQHHEPYNQTMPHHGGPPRFAGHLRGGNRGAAGFSGHNPGREGFHQAHIKPWQHNEAIVEAPYIEQEKMREPVSERTKSRERRAKPSDESGDKREKIKEKQNKSPDKKIAKKRQEKDAEGGEEQLGDEKDEKKKKKVKKTGSTEKKKVKKETSADGKEKKKKKLKKEKIVPADTSDEPAKEDDEQAKEDDEPVATTEAPKPPVPIPTVVEEPPVPAPVKIVSVAPFSFNSVSRSGAEFLAINQEPTVMPIAQSIPAPEEKESVVARIATPEPTPSEEKVNNSRKRKGSPQLPEDTGEKVAKHKSSGSRQSSAEQGTMESSHSKKVVETKDKSDDRKKEELYSRKKKEDSEKIRNLKKKEGSDKIQDLKKKEESEKARDSKKEEEWNKIHDSKLEKSYKSSLKLEKEKLKNPVVEWSSDKERRERERERDSKTRTSRSKERHGEARKSGGDKHKDEKRSHRDKDKTESKKEDTKVRPKQEEPTSAEKQKEEAEPIGKKSRGEHRKLSKDRAESSRHSSGKDKDRPSQKEQSSKRHKRHGHEDSGMEKSAEREHRQKVSERIHVETENDSSAAAVSTLLWQVGRKSKSKSAEELDKPEKRILAGEPRVASKDMPVEEKMEIAVEKMKGVTETASTEEYSADSSKKDKKKKKKNKKEHKKHKKAKEKHKSPRPSSIKMTLEPVASAQIVESADKVEERKLASFDCPATVKPTPLKSFRAVKPVKEQPTIKMQVSHPRTMVSSKWEDESSESENESIPPKSILQQNALPKSVKERLGVKRTDPQPTQQYQKTSLSPQTVARAEHAILSKMRKARPGASSSSLVITADRQDRKVSLEGSSEPQTGGRRVVSSGSMDKLLSVTVSESGSGVQMEPHHIASKELRRVSRYGEKSEKTESSGADTDERASERSGGRRSSGNSKPVKLRKAWKSSTDESDK